MEKRNELIDIAKAIGIISVMIGHSCAVLPLTKFPISVFVYTYHLAIFFFTAGFCYNDKKYAERPDTYIYKRIVKLAVMYFLYNLFFVLIHNILADLSLISAAKYSINQSYIWIVTGTMLNTNEAMLGAFWFIPVFLIASLFFGLEFSLSTYIGKKKKDKRVKYLIDIVFLIICIFVGYFAHSKGMFLQYHVQTAFLAIPIIYVGWIVRVNYNKIEKHINASGLLNSILLLYIAINELHFRVELSQNVITNIFEFYIFTFVGMYFCLSLSKLLMKLKITRNSLSFVGKNSFHFMALHLLVFKIIDLIISYNLDDSLIKRSAFPTSYSIGLSYVIISTIVISLILLVVKKRKKLKI